MNLSQVPRAILMLAAFALAVLLLGGVIAKFGRSAQSAVGNVV